MHMMTSDQSARLQPRRTVRPLIVACCLWVVCGVSSCAAPADSAGRNPAGSRDSERNGTGVPVAPASGGESAPQEAGPLEKPTVEGQDTSPRTSSDSSVPVRTDGRDTVVVAAPGLQPVATSQPSPETIVEAPVTSEPTPAKQPLEVPTGRPPVQDTPRSARPVYDGPVSGKLTCTGAPVIQNGEVVFVGLPPGRLQITYDTATWDARVRADETNTQKVVLRNKRPGVQRSCTVTWQLLE